MDEHLLLQYLLEMPPRELTRDAQHAVDAYTVRLCEFLTSCAANQRRSPEVFLWNARRVLETLCHILVTVGQNAPSRSEANRQDRTLEQVITMLHQEDYLDDEQVTRLHSIRRYANLGVHVRRPERENYPAAVGDLSQILPAAVTWLVLESRAAPFIHERDELLSVAERIRAEVHRGQPTPPEVTDEGRITDRGRVTPRPALVEPVEDDQTEEAEPERPSRPVRARAERPTGPVHAPAEPPRPTRWILPLTLATALGVGLGVALALGFTRADPASPAPTPDPEPVTAAVASPAPEVAAAPAPASCPEGRTRIGSSTIKLGLPRGRGSRDAWAQTLTGPRRPVEVPAFCIDTRPVTRAAFEAWPESALAKKTRCDWSATSFAAEGPVACVSRDDANRYCQSLSPPAALPTLPQWEAVKRAAPEALTAGVTGEWALDLFPPEVLGPKAARCSHPSCGGGVYRKALADSAAVSPDGDLLWSWEDQAPGNGWSNIGFRCASPLVDGSEAQ